MTSRAMLGLLVQRLRKRSAEYNKMATIRKNSDEATKEESMLEKATALAIGEMADCIEEVLIVEQETR